MAAAEPNIMAEEIWPKIEAWIGWDVVAVVLRQDRDAVDGVFEECVETIWRVEWRHEKANGLVVVASEEDFFTPVAKEIGN